MFWHNIDGFERVDSFEFFRNLSGRGILRGKPAPLPRGAWPFCIRCGHETTLRSGTVMQGSNLPVSDWFVTMFLLTATKRAIFQVFDS